MFRGNAELLREYAIDAGLENDDMSGERRSRLYREFFRRMKGWDDGIRTVF